MNSRASGLIVRFFKVTIPIGGMRTGSSTGSTLSPSRAPPNDIVELESIPR